MVMEFIKNKNILITGGTGSFGNNFIKTIISKYSPNKVIVYSRDEMKQYEMQQFFQIMVIFQFVIFWGTLGIRKG